MAMQSQSGFDHPITLPHGAPASCRPLNAPAAFSLVVAGLLAVFVNASPELCAQEKNISESSRNATEPELKGILSPADRGKAIARWEKEIARLERLDRTHDDPENAVMLMGSSSIRLWEDAAEMLAPYPIIRRGYGGARYSDLVVFAKRLVSPHEYRALVVFVANDITGSNADRPVDAVRKMVLHVIAVSQEHQPDAPVLLVEVTPTPSRWGVWPQIRELNAMMREIALTHPGVSFVSTAQYYLDDQDVARPELFRQDQLHQNEPGYQIWADIIRRRLDEVLGGATPPATASAKSSSQQEVSGAAIEGK
ncbi:GDSL-type esterase/lipase family protein [Allorhodopirellula solitaria]|uniref:SGNH hydrolase-type esterase domain-containing protein n=1 Tax=Allorhodopirellula solitaria TaxID=2527987 RepID=A0A5C5XX80_9BACT|nr:GDSL-type esterase/lipase family protein [Allorhodopirellula solitaria]TWT66212.1 hypothetical protein CA85_30760 [Allorhodopirellula solitaria]